MQKTLAEEMLDVVSGVMETVLNEFMDDSPTSIVATDFDVQLLKFSIAYKNGSIDNEELCALVKTLCDVEKVWRKLNDVK